ncbi:hypothetical protein GCM10020218_050440 [Dactylosporangium vinaceum]
MTWIVLLRLCGYRLHGISLNEAGDSVDWAGKREELLSIGSIFQALAPSERLKVFGSRQILSFPLY